MKHLHILGICGTFMGGLAILAKQLGFHVTGSDENVYPPMSTLLSEHGISITMGFDPAQLNTAIDHIIVGNVMKRGMPIVEALLNSDLPYTSGPAWLKAHVLKNRWVLAVAGTHGKTTTASILTHLLSASGLTPGFLIGGIPQNFKTSAQLGTAPYFVIEADEYDTAFFDKRSKFIHYCPKTLIANNLEFDHADLFDSITEIQKQFHHLIRILPSKGLLIENSTSPALQAAIALGCWTPRISFAGQHSDWQAECTHPDGSRFNVLYHGKKVAQVTWEMLGLHNVHNALAALIAADHIGLPPQETARHLSTFQGVKRRLQLRGEIDGIRVYDDFAHHPTAIRVTLEALRAHIRPNARILCILEPRSNTMRMGTHGAQVRDALQQADYLLLYEPPGLNWNLDSMMAGGTAPFVKHTDIAILLSDALNWLQSGDHVLIMSNGGFQNIHETLLQQLRTKK